jgi:ubiquinone/menaquinone biosynthesis C-methylase UbiE
MMLLSSRRRRREVGEMTGPQIRFEDGAAYERMMGVWSRLAGEVFIDWLAPQSGLRWIDVGCGSGAFSQLIIERCAPAEVQGIDPSDAQLAYARSRPTAQLAQFRVADARALPFPENRFDVAVMALVVFFVPDPKKGVAEMARVVRPGGLVASYTWDILHGGFPNEPLMAAMRKSGRPPPLPPSAAASEMNALETLWREAGLDQIDSKEISVSRTFRDFDDFWSTSTLGTNVRAMIAGMSAKEIEELQSHARRQVTVGSTGTITCKARANAIKGRVPY